MPLSVFSSRRSGRSFDRPAAANRPRAGQSKDKPLQLLHLVLDRLHSIGFGVVALSARRQVSEEICRETQEKNSSSTTLRPSLRRPRLAGHRSTPGGLRISPLPHRSRHDPKRLFAELPGCRSLPTCQMSARRPGGYFSSPPSSEKSAMVVNSRNSSESSARRFFRTASSSAITITSRKNWSTALRSPAISSRAS